MYDTVLPIIYYISTQAETMNELDKIFINQIWPMELNGNGEDIKNKDLDISEIKPEDDAELNFFCRDSCAFMAVGMENQVMQRMYIMYVSQS